MLTVSGLTELSEQGYSKTRAAKHYGVTRQAVSLFCKKHGISMVRGRPGSVCTIDIGEVRRYLSEGLKGRDIARQMNRSISSLSKACKSVGIILPNQFDQRMSRILRMADKGCTRNEICERMSMSDNALVQFCRRRGVKIVTNRWPSNQYLRTKSEEGKTMSDLSEQTGYHAAGIRRRLIGAGIIRE